MTNQSHTDTTTTTTTTSNKNRTFDQSCEFQMRNINYSKFRIYFAKLPSFFDSKLSLDISQPFLTQQELLRLLHFHLRCLQEFPIEILSYSLHN